MTGKTAKDQGGPNQQGPNHQGLRLMAEDAADLKVMSAALQDAVATREHFTYEPTKRRFSAELNRFRWEVDKPRGRIHQRVRTAFALEGVLSVRARGLAAGAAGDVLQVLSLEWVPDTEPPGGQIAILLAGGGEIRVTVECVDAMLIDMSAPWPTRHKPDHSKDKAKGGR
jgi:hypothetical protein